MESKYLWMNGEMVEYEKATLTFLDPTLHYGVGVFRGHPLLPNQTGSGLFFVTGSMYIGYLILSIGDGF
jgi:branched-chain amino acid aminotransferase